MASNVQVATKKKRKADHKSTSSKVCLTIYEVLFILLKEEDSGVLKLAILRMIDFFQLMVFPFDSDAQFPWRAGNLFTSLQSVIEVFQIINYLSGFPWFTYLIVFYLGILLVLLVILDIVYVLYSIARKNFAFVWPLKALTSFCSIFLTVLFLPLLKLFVSMLSCKLSENGLDYVNSYYTEVICWRGFHILHAVMAIVISIVFILISLIVTLTFYEAKAFTTNAGSRSEVFLIIYKIACIFLFAFFYNAEYSWLLVAVLFLGSIYSYWQCKVERPYYNETLAILWDVTNVVYLYVNSVLFLCMLLKDTNFAGGLQLIVLGIPIVAVVEYLRKHPKCKWITKEFDLLEDGLECSQYLRYFTYVVQNKHELENKVMLEGFINKHIEACNEENCQIKIYRDKYSSKATVGRNALAGKMVLATYLKKLHKKALKRFPTCPTLRIRYAFFLLEIMQDTLGAQKQLQKARANNPQLDEDFVIFRYSRIIEEQMAEYKHQGEAVGMDRVSLIAYDNYFRQCKKKMKEAAKLHMEFWAGLNAQVPDITQLIKIGGKINKVISEIEEYWGLLQGLNANMPKAIRRYAKFLRDVLGDEDNAKELLKSIKQDNIKRPGKELDDIDNEIDYGQYFLDICSSDGTPCICISGEVENLGIITSVNKALCRVFGYSPVELMGQHMNKLIPPLLVTHHTNIVKAVTENPDSFQLLNKELLIPCQLSNGYVLMVHKTIKALPSFSNNMNYVVTFKIDRASEVKNVCHLLLDDKGFITSMSGSNFSLLDSL